MKRTNTREFFRVPYPHEERPRFVVHRQICEVIDCSERGLRYRASLLPAPAIGTELEGKLRMRQGQEVRVRGVVVRVWGSEVALHLREPGVSFHTILKEQLYLRRREREEVEEGDAL